MRRFEDEFGFLAIWRDVLKERAAQAVDKISEIRTVRGLILAGGLGRGAEWPLSDIDLIGIYAHRHFESTKAQVGEVRTALEASWADEGFSVGLDIKGIVFSETEVERALALMGSEVISLLGDKRFFHGMDKAHGGQVVYDPAGLAASFLGWVNRERYSADVTSARVRDRRTDRDQAMRTARARLKDRSHVLDASLAVDLSVVANLRLLMEIWGDRGSARRGPTFSERRAAQQGETALVECLLRFRRFDVVSGQNQMSKAPGRVEHYRRLSWESRQGVSEHVSAEQNARDAVVWEGGVALRQEQPPFDVWMGVDTDPEAVETRWGELEKLVRSKRCSNLDA
jgi:hypothetical protein